MSEVNCEEGGVEVIFEQGGVSKEDFCSGGEETVEQNRASRYILRVLKAGHARLVTQWPRLGELSDAANAATLFVERAAKEIKNSEALQLRSLDELPDLASDVARLSDGLALLQEEISKCSKVSAFMALLVGLKFARVTTSLTEELVKELLRGETLLTKIGLACTCVPGWVMVYHFRSTITKDIDFKKEVGRRGVPAALALDVEGYQQLFQNLRRLPPVFWLATAASSLVMLQSLQSGGTRIVQIFGRSRKLQFLAVLGILGHTQRSELQKRFKDSDFRSAIAPVWDQLKIRLQNVPVQEWIEQARYLVMLYGSKVVDRLRELIVSNVSKLRRPSSLDHMAATEKNPQDTTTIQGEDGESSPNGIRKRNVNQPS